MPAATPGLKRLARRKSASGPRAALAITSFTTTVAAAWLLWLGFTMLPVREPLHAGLWRLVAAGLLAFSALSLAALRPGVRGAFERGLLTALGVVAVGSGLGAALRVFGMGHAAGPFEDYLLVLGTLVAVHGFSALAVAFPQPSTGGPPAA
jgi:hypothetical protein